MMDLAHKLLRMSVAIKHRVAHSETRQGWRRKRMASMLELVGLPSNARIVDLGGTHEIWRGFERDFQVTLINLPASDGPAAVRHPGFTYIEHDACDLTDVLADQSFDFVFSNSTIEHVGDEPRQEQFAREVRRLARAYWVQTPSDRFPLEVHTWVPYYWKLPQSARDRLMRRWQRIMPTWSEMVQGTRVLTRQRMQDLFPDAKCYVERLLGLEKSYAFYRPYREEA
jgi:hypothetical protein